MNFKLTLSLLLASSCLGAGSREIESNFFREEQCAKKNGFYVLEDECPVDVATDIKTLCPSQQKAEASCCPHIKQTDVNCFQLHNECKETCPDHLNLGRKGCPKNSVCCVLV